MTVPSEATPLLRPELLAGVSVVLAGAAAGQRGPARAIRTTLAGLGAQVHECQLVCSGEPEADDAGVALALGEALTEPGGVQALVVDAASLFASESTRDREGVAPSDRAGSDGSGSHRSGGADARGLIATLEAAWRVTRAVANAAFIASGTRGRIVYLSPPTLAAGSSAGLGTHPAAEASLRNAEAARAGIENLARTLSIEWARYQIAPISIAPGPSTRADELAGLVAYLLSPAGAYFSGTQLDLRGPGATAER